MTSSKNLHRTRSNQGASSAVAGSDGTLATAQKRVNRLAVGRTSTGPDPLEQLGQLDDVVFEAIAGRPGALSGLKELWPEVKSTLGPALVDESRDQYVRHALRVWRESLQGNELRNADAALAALDVVSLLFDE